MKTSITAAINKIPNASNNKSAESKSTCSNFLVLKSCFITATDIIPPAKPAKKYASISGIPWGAYLNNPKHDVVR